MDLISEILYRSPLGDGFMNGMILLAHLTGLKSPAVQSGERVGVYGRGSVERECVTLANRYPTGSLFKKLLAVADLTIIAGARNG
jgi:hypothetical protein